MTLLYDLAPANRGLVRQNDMSVWAFPPDYIQRLRNALGEVNPQFKVQPERPAIELPPVFSHGSLLLQN